MEKVEVTRQELYNLVWSKPMSKLALKYNLSDNGLRKICKKHEIPLPLLGHWQKIQYNKKVKVIPLTKDIKREDNITINKGEIKENEGITNFSKLLKEITDDTTLSFKVPDKLSNPDKLTSEAKEDLANKSKEKYGIYRGITTTSNGVISISVAPKNYNRALRIMDKIIKLLKQRGHKSITTIVEIKDEEIKIRLRERLKRITIPDAKYSWSSTDCMSSN